MFSTHFVRFSSYQTGGFYDEMFAADDLPRLQARLAWLSPAIRVFPQVPAPVSQ